MRSILENGGYIDSKWVTEGDWKRQYYGVGFYDYVVENRNWVYTPAERAKLDRILEKFPDLKVSKRLTPFNKQRIERVRSEYPEGHWWDTEHANYGIPESRRWKDLTPESAPDPNYLKWLQMDAEERAYVKRISEVAPGSLRDQENLMNVVDGLINYGGEATVEYAPFNLPLMSRYRSVYFPSDGGTMSAKFKATFPDANVVGGSLRKQTETIDGFTLAHADNTKEFPFADDSFDAVLAMRTLCKCDTAAKTCGGVCNATLRSFIKETIRVLDKRNPLSIAILHKGPNPYDLEEWTRILKEECDRTGMEFRYVLFNQSRGMIHAIVIKSKGSFESTAFRELMNQTLPKDYSAGRIIRSPPPQN